MATGDGPRRAAKPVAAGAERAGVGAALLAARRGAVGEGLDEWLPYTRDRLDREWPDRLRTWLVAWRHKSVAANALARQLDVAGAQVKNMRQCVAALEARPAPC